MYRFIIILFISLFFHTTGRCQPMQLRDTTISQQFITGMMLTDKQVALYRQCRDYQRHALDSIAIAGIMDRDARSRAMRAAIAGYRNLFYTSLSEEQKRRYDLLEKTKKEKFQRDMQKRNEALQSAQSPEPQTNIP
jgi:hypothetical protein